MVTNPLRIGSVLEVGSETLDGEAVSMMTLALTSESSCSPQCHGCPSRQPLTLLLLSSGREAEHRSIRPSDRGACSMAISQARHWWHLSLAIKGHWRQNGACPLQTCPPLADKHLLNRPAAKKPFREATCRAPSEDWSIVCLYAMYDRRLLRSLWWIQGSQKRCVEAPCAVDWDIFQMKLFKESYTLSILPWSFCLFVCFRFVLFCFQGRSIILPN